MITSWLDSVRIESAVFRTDLRQNEVHAKARAAWEITQILPASWTDSRERERPRPPA